MGDLAKTEVKQPLVQRSQPTNMRIDPQEQRITSVIAAGAVSRGNLSLKEGIKVNGHHVGDLEFGTEDGMLIVSKNAVIEGNVIGPKAIILGSVKGTLMISGHLVLAQTAKLYGEAIYGSIVAYDGALIDGTLKPNDAAIAKSERPALEVVKAATTV